MAKHPDLLYLKSIMRPTPAELCASGVKVVRALQEQGEFVVTFPRAYHAGFSHGCNIGEAVNFATSHWLSFGRLAIERYRSITPVVKKSVIQHEQLLFELAGSTAAGPTVLTHVRAELRLLRAEYAVLIKDLEDSGTKTTAVAPESEFSDFVGVQCEVCNHSCHIGAVLLETGEATKRFCCMQHCKQIEHDAAKSQGLLWKNLDDMDEYASRIDLFFARGGATEDKDGRRCSVCMRGGNLLGPFSVEQFYGE